MPVDENPNGAKLQLGQRLSLGLPPTPRTASHESDSSGLRNTKRSSKELCNIAGRWKKGIYQPKILCSFSQRQIPRLKRVGYELWVSQNNTLAALPVSAEGLIRQQPAVVLTSPAHDDVTCFSVQGRRLVAGDSMGSLLCRRGGGKELRRQAWETVAIRAVEFVDDRVITGCRWNTVRVGRVSDDGRVSEVHSASYDDSREVTWCIAAQQGSSKFVTGSSGADGSPLKLWDLGSMTYTNVRDAATAGRASGAIYKASFLSDHVVLTCGSASVVCLTDLRTGRNEQTWCEPFDAGAYSFATDGRHALVTGTAYHGMCRLWDMRQTKSLQVYYVTRHLDQNQQVLPPRQRRQVQSNSTPIYGLEMTPSRLVAAHHLGVAVLDFDPRCGPLSPRDYSHVAC